MRFNFKKPLSLLVLKKQLLTHSSLVMRLQQFSYSSGCFPGGSDSKVSVYSVGDPGSSPGLGRSPGEGDGNPLQDYCLENPMEEAGRLQSMGTQRDRTERLHFLWAPLLILVLLLFLPHLQLFPSLEF